MLPSIKSTLSGHIGIVSQESDCGILIFCQQFGCHFFNTFLRIIKSRFHLFLSCTHVTDHQIITRIDHIRHPVENPESGIPGERDVVCAIYTCIAQRGFRRTAINRSKYGHIRIIHSKPKNATYGVRLVGTHLCNKYEATLLSRNRTFVKILLITYLEIQWRKAIRGFIRTGTEIIGNIKRCSFVVVTHHIFHILYGKFTVRLYEKRHRSICLSFYIRKIVIPMISKFIEIAPHTGFAETTGTEIKWRISLSKAEILVHTIEVTFLASEGNHIRRSDTVFFVVHVKLVDTGLIGMSRDTIIRYTYSHPDSTTYPRSLTDHFHNPDFIRIGNRKRFTSTIIAILLYQVSHDTDRFAGRT